MLRTRPRVVSQPLLSKIALEETSSVEKVDSMKPGLTRSSSVKSVKRKPVPAMTELDFVPTVPKTIKPVRNPETSSHTREDSGFGLLCAEEEEEVLASNPASPVPQLEADSSSDSSPSGRLVSLSRLVVMLSRPSLRSSDDPNRRAADFRQHEPDLHRQAQVESDRRRRRALALGSVTYLD
jgi:hypothetical protein